MDDWSKLQSLKSITIFKMIGAFVPHLLNKD